MSAKPLPDNLRVIVDKMRRSPHGLPNRHLSALYLMSEEKRIRVITELLFPAVGKEEFRTVGQGEQILFQREHKWDATQQATVMEAYARTLADPARLLNRAWWWNVDIILVDAPRRMDDVSMLGSACRTMGWYAEAEKQQLAAWLAEEWLNKESLPLPIAARMAVLTRLSDRDRAWSPLTPAQADSLRNRAREQYAEFAELPTELLIDTLACLPIPDEWFQDAWEIPRPWREPFGAFQHPIWVELTGVDANTPLTVPQQEPVEG